MKKWPEMNECERKEMAEWVKTLCLLCGTQLSTAYKVAGSFVEGLDKDCGLVQ